MNGFQSKVLYSSRDTEYFLQLIRLQTIKSTKNKQKNCFVGIVHCSIFLIGRVVWWGIMFFCFQNAIIAENWEIERNKDFPVGKSIYCLWITTKSGWINNHYQIANSFLAPELHYKSLCQSVHNIFAIVVHILMLQSLQLVVKGRHKYLNLKTPK